VISAMNICPNVRDKGLFEIYTKLSYNESINYYIQTPEVNAQASVPK
jgi:hypothetical protein